MTTTVQKWGNSKGIRLSKHVVESLRLQENQKLEVIIQDNQIVLRPVAKKRKTIEELFAGYEGTYQPEELSWGASAGEEVW